MSPIFFDASLGGAETLACLLYILAEILMILKVIVMWERC